MKITCSMITSIFLGIFMCSAVQAEIAISDPTQPIYRQGFVGSSSEVRSAASDEASREVPHLVQLIYSKSRKIAMFGDEFFRPGDEAPFGKIVSIEKDRVILEHDGIIEDVLLFDPDTQSEKDDQSEISG